MKYTVTVYPVVQITLPSVNAESQEEALRKVISRYELNDFDFGEALYSDTVDGYLVDEENDPHRHNTTRYNKHGMPQ